MLWQRPVRRYTDVIRRYADFDGRANRPEFWWFQLINLIVYALILIVATAAAGRAGGEFLGSLYSLAVLLPGLGVDIRRLHDTDRSGWWVLLGVFPILGGLILVVFFARAGSAGPNRFGPSPAPAHEPG